MRRVRRHAPTAAKALGLAVVFGGLFVAAALFGLALGLPDIDSLETRPRTAAVTFLDRHDRMITTRGDGAGEAITADDLPETLVEAVLAVEDRRFYDHHGVDLRGTARALIANIRAGRVVQGGSTITQQLAKNLFLTPERSYRRKAREMLLALELERRYSKDEILALYLNRVYFGAGAWGADAAARRYFGKPADNLTLGEAALLAGLLKAPSRYSPTNDARRAAVRATVVLDLMHASGRITEDERIAAAQTPIRVSRGASSPGAGWFADWAAAEVRERVTDYDGDLVVRTTLDVDAQRAAEDALAAGLADPELARGAETGALVALDLSGGVVAMVGGRDYASSPYNRAVSARRQPGSAFKPFVYAAAFESGYEPNDRFFDGPIAYGDWSPQNYGDTYEGEMSLERAFARSSNVIAVQLAEATGRHYVQRAARRLGIESPLQPTRSLALGAYEVTPLELASAYAPFANGGRSVAVHAIESIETTDGRVLWRREPAPGRTIIASRVIADMNRLFDAAGRYGTARGAQVPGRQVRGKTGTTNDFRDAWFAGWSEGLVAAVWTGNDDGSPTDHAVGGAGPARIFADFMGSAPIYPGQVEPAPYVAERGDEAPAAERPAREGDPIGALLERLGG
ncbi:transglycosylase domain-containing protein [Marinicauda salina]|nr:PBP1A family penicillin-binding protein [Marinicauda salina]